MKSVEDLKYFGKPTSDVTLNSEGKKYSKKIRGTVMAELRVEVGIIGIIKLLLKARKETNRGKALDWSSIKERGIANQRFLNFLIAQMSTVKALADIVGKDKASSILRRGFDKAVDITSPIYPSPEDFKACGDGFSAFREYMKQRFTAGHVNASDLEIVEDSPRALAINVKYCHQCEVAKKLGDHSLCYSVSCYGEEVYMSKTLPELGARFKRTGTLSTGAPMCDFRFELVNKSNAV
jgi:predicted hydrocarbon binding protein